MEMGEKVVFAIECEDGIQINIGEAKKARVKISKEEAIFSLFWGEVSVLITNPSETFLNELRGYRSEHLFGGPFKQYYAYDSDLNPWNYK